MPVLQNVKHELFAQTLIETNGDAEKTMEIVGYKYSPSFFSQLKHNPKIAARIREIQKLALTDKVLDLTGRLELLSEFARNPALKPSARIRALSELHKQSGDDVSKVSMDLSAETKNVIKFVVMNIYTNILMIQMRR